MPENRKTFLPFHQPLLGEEEEREVIDTLRSGWITTGPKTKRFEAEFAEFTGADCAIAVNSCTAALHLALAALDIGPGDEVITTPITFAATVNVIEHQGATPVFVDVEPDTLNIDATKIEERITSRTKAIIPVHFAGHPCDMDEISRLAVKYGLAVIEDAAHAVEAEYKGRRIGSISEMTAFSFYATKNITTGEGGMLTLCNSSLEDKIRVLSLHGISKDAWKRYSDEGYKHWEIIYPGYKYNMFDIQAALGLCQLKKIEAFWQKRRDIVDFYNDAFADVAEIKTLAIGQHIKHAYHIYVVVIKSELLDMNRDVIMNEIQAKNIGIGIHFRAVHLHPYYRAKYPHLEGTLPHAEYASERVISLPLYPKMSLDDARDVISVVRNLVESSRST